MLAAKQLAPPDHTSFHAYIFTPLREIKSVLTQTPDVALLQCMHLSRLGSCGAVCSCVGLY